MGPSSKDYGASLSFKARLITYAVGFGVGLGVPSVLGIGFAVGFGSPFLVLLPLPFGLALFLAWLHRTTGYRVSSDAITVLRPMRERVVDITKVSTIHFPAPTPPGNVWGLWRVDGIFGTQGTYWNRSWGKFWVFVTNEQNTVEILLKDGTHVLLSPDEPEEFVKDVLSRLPS